MKIKKSLIKPINPVKVGNINFVSSENVKFTKDETKLAMRMANRLRKRAAKKFNCTYGDVSMSLCLKEAYARILNDKLHMSGILSKKNKQQVRHLVKQQFGYNNIDTLIRKRNIKDIVPKNVQQNIVLNLAKLEMRTRMEFI